MSVCSTWKSEKKILFKTMEMDSFDPKHHYNFMYRPIEFSPKMERVVCIQEQFICVQDIWGREMEEAANCL